jgi:subtilase family serine protease
VVVGALAAGAAVGGTVLPATAALPDPSVAGAVAVAQPQTAEGVSHPLQLTVLGRGPDAVPLLAGSGATGYTPAQVRASLGLTGTGAGQTIAIVTAYDAPNVVKDLAVFNAAFGLPAPPSFRKVGQTGGTKLPAVNASWALEAALDVQWAHAVAPAAGILLVEATTNSLTNLMTAVSWAAAQPGVSVVSGSFGIPEYLRQKDHDARCKLLAGACVFASGDTGNPAAYPATAPWALGVGGTTLQLDADGAVLGETAWSGSGGGVSTYTPKPAWQGAASTAVRRASPDVSYAGDPVTGFATYSSTPYLGQSGWFQMGGTSAGAPQWAGILAVTNQLRKAAGKPVLAAATAAGATPLHTAIYSAAARAAMFDVSTGTNGTCGLVCTARTGYDTVTGVGSPRRGIDVVLRDAV